MSACRAMRLRVAAYADDELDVASAAEVESHLAACATCREAVEAQRALTAAVRELYPQPAVPDDAVERTRIALFGRSIVPRALVGLGVAASLALIALLSALRGSVPATPASVLEAARAHERADAGELALEIRTEDVGAVDAWLRASLPFAASLPDAPAEAIRVAGAAHVAIGGERAGLVRYRVGERFASLFLLARPSWAERGRAVTLRGIEFRVFEVDGLSLVAWSHPPLSYLLVSDVAAPLGESCGVCHGSGRRPVTDFATALAGSA